jgi:hypothetical protein
MNQVLRSYVASQQPAAGSKRPHGR